MGAPWQQAFKTSVELAVTERKQLADLVGGPGDTMGYSGQKDVLTQEPFMVAAERSLDKWELQQGNS
jgi:hypothetical protein